MALTRAAIEARLVLANRGLLELASLPTDASGSNAAVGAVLEDALLRMGYSVATAGGPTDGEVAVVPAARHPYLYALANVLLLEFVFGTVCALPTEQANAQRVEWGRVTESLRLRIARGWEQLAEVRRSASGGLVGGPMQERPYPPDAFLEPWTGTP